jgi:hypothetical protein
MALFGNVVMQDLTPIFSLGIGFCLVFGWVDRQTQRDASLT